MPSPLIQSNPHSIATVTSVTGPRFTVHYWNIPDNKAVSGTNQTFVQDVIGTQPWAVGQTVLVQYTSNPRVKDSAIQVDGRLVVVVSPELRDSSPKLQKGYWDEWLRSLADNAQVYRDAAHETWNGLPSSAPALTPGQADALSKFADSTNKGSIYGNNGSPIDREPWLAEAVPCLSSELEATDPSYLRIGYVELTLDNPVEAISFQEQPTGQLIQPLRSRTPVQRSGQHVQQTISISFIVEGSEAQNRILLPLARMCRRAPFMPVKNELLNEQHNITALALLGLSIQTVPDHPNIVTVTLTAAPFNWEPLLPNAIESFDGQICYPLLKLWLESPIEQRDSGTPADFRPMLGQWSGDLQFWHVKKSWIQTANQYGDAAQAVGRRNADIVTASKALQLLNDPEARRNVQANQNNQTLNTSGPTLIYTPIAGFQVVMVLRDAQTAQVLLKDISSLTVADSNSVKLERSSLTAVDGFGDVTPSTPALNYTNLNIGDFRSLLARNNVGTVNSLNAGQYTFIVSPGSQGLTALANQSAQLAELPNQATQWDAGDPMLPDGIIVESITATLQNNCVPLQVRDHRTPTYQYLGSTALQYTVSALVERSGIGKINSFFDTLASYARQFPGRTTGQPFGGLMLADNEILNFFGTSTVLPLSWEWATIPDQPDYCQLNLTLVEFDETQRQREALNDLMSDLKDHPNATPNLYSAFDDVQTRYTRQLNLEDRLSRVELYPDLQLPTLKTLKRWVQDITNDDVWNWVTDQPNPNYQYLDWRNGGTGWQWSTSERKSGSRTIAIPLPKNFLEQAAPIPDPGFAEPDFYCSASHIHGSELVETLLQDVTNNEKLGSLVLYDQHNAVMLQGLGERMEDIHSSRIHDPDETIAAGETSKKKNAIKPTGSQHSTDAEAAYLADPSSKIPPHVEIATAFRDRNGNVIPVEDYRKQGADLYRSNLPSPYLAAAIAHYGPTVRTAAAQHHVDPALLMALADQESSWNPLAINPTNSAAVGMFQILTSVAESINKNLLHIDNPENYYRRTDPAQAAAMAAALLEDMQRKPIIKDSLENLIAAYNQGEGAVQRARGIPEAANEYVRSVKVKYAFYESYLRGQPGNYAGTPQDRADALAQQLIHDQQEGKAFKWIGYMEPHMIQDGAGTMSEQMSYGPAGAVPSSVFKGRAASKDVFIRLEWIARPQLQSINNTDVSGPLAGAIDYAIILPKFAKAFVVANERSTSPLKLSTPPDQYNQHAIIQASQVAKAEDIAQRLDPPTTPERAFYDPKTKNDAFSDLRQSMFQGRLVQAFPTFYCAIVDQGSRLRIWRLFDHVYGMNAVTRINVHRTSEGPVDVAVLGFGNMYGHLTAGLADIEREKRHDLRGPWDATGWWMVPFNGDGEVTSLRRIWNSLFEIDPEAQRAWAESVRATALQPGNRLHVRLGFGSQCVRLPIVFNGVISSTSVEEGELEVVGVSDGVELLNDMPPNASLGSKPTSKITDTLGAGENPRTIVHEILNPLFSHNPWQEALKAWNITNSVNFGKSFSPFYMEDLFSNKFGIEHFGKPWINPRPGSTILIRDRNQMVDFECGINLFDPTQSVPTNFTDSLSDWFTTLDFQHWDNRFKLIGLQITNANPWSVFDVSRKTIPGYRLATVPVGFRSTVFMGKPWFPLRMELRSDLTKAEIGQFRNQLENSAGWEVLAGDNKGLRNMETGKINQLMDRMYRWKTFQQIHVLHGGWNLLSNEVRADDEGVFTQCQAVGTCGGWTAGNLGFGVESGWLMQVDSDIYPEHQKTKVIESGLYNTVLQKVTDSPLGIVGDTLGKFIGLNRSRRVMDHYAAAELVDSIGRMYKGTLGMLGDGTVKPQDLIMLHDSLSTMNGLCEVREVIHTFRPETGFVTEIVPDCCAHYALEHDTVNYMNWVAIAGHHIAQSLLGAGTVGVLSRYGSNSFINSTVKLLRKDLVALDKTFADAVGDVDKTRALAELKISRDDVKAALVEVDTIMEKAPGASWLAGRRATASKKVIQLSLQGADTAAGTAGSSLAKVLPHLQNSRPGVYLMQAIQQLPEVARKGSAALQAYLTEKASDLGENAKDLVGKIKASEDELVRILGVAGPAEIEAAIQKLAKDAADKSAAAILAGNAEEAARIAKSLGNHPAILEYGNLRKFKLAGRGAGFAGRAVGAVGSAAAAVDGLVVKAVTTKLGTVMMMAAQMIILGAIAEAITRATIARQCIIIMPLRIGTFTEFTAGIRGHRGAVLGDRPGGLDLVIQNSLGWLKHAQAEWWLPVIGDVISRLEANNNFSYTHPALPGP